MQLVFDNTDFFIHVSMSGLSISGLFLLGAIAPLILVSHLGKTKLPSENIDGLVDRIIQENMQDLLTDDRKYLREIISKEINVGSARAQDKL